MFLERLETVYRVKVDNCIYALVNEEDKRIEIFATVNLLSHLNNICKNLDSVEYGFLFQDLKKVEIQVLENNVLETDKWLKLQSYRVLYRDKGYSFYKDDPIVKYTIREVVENYDRRVRLNVYAENYNSKILVGSFVTKEECEDFLTINYPDRVADYLVYGDMERIEEWKRKRKKIKYRNGLY